MRTTETMMRLLLKVDDRRCVTKWQEICVWLYVYSGAELMRNYVTKLTSRSSRAYHVAAITAKISKAAIFFVQSQSDIVRVRGTGSQLKG